MAAVIVEIRLIVKIEIFICIKYNIAGGLISNIDDVIMNYFTFIHFCINLKSIQVYNCMINTHRIDCYLWPTQATLLQQSK